MVQDHPGNGRIARSDGTSSPAQRANGGFGERNANKSTKAVIGIAILIVLSIALYELRPNRATQTSSASPAITQYAVASIS